MNEMKLKYTEIGTKHTILHTKIRICTLVDTIWLKKIKYTKPNLEGVFRINALIENPIFSQNFAFSLSQKVPNREAKECQDFYEQK